MMYVFFKKNQLVSLLVTNFLSRPIKNLQFCFKNNRQDLIGAKHTPGCVFLFLLQEKTLQRVMLGRDDHNAKVYTLCCGCAKIVQCRKPEQVCCCCYFFSFPVSFTVVIVLFHTKLVLLFFACCCFLTFWMLLFVRVEDFPAAIMLLCLCLLLANIISWPSPFPPVFFLFILIFFTATKMFSVLAVLLLCFLLRFSVVLSAFFLLFTFLILPAQLKNIFVWHCLFLLRS